MGLCERSVSLVLLPSLQPALILQWIRGLQNHVAFFQYTLHCPQNPHCCQRTPWPPRVHPRGQQELKRDWAPHEVLPLLWKDAQCACTDSSKGASSHQIGYCPACPAMHVPLGRTCEARRTQLPHETKPISGRPNAPVHTVPSCARPDGVEWTQPSVHRDATERRIVAFYSQGLDQDS